MRARSRHPRLVAAACRVYDVAIRLYPAEFRHAFAAELAVTFRNRTEDVVNEGGVRDWLGFAIHIGLDWIRTWWTVPMRSDTSDSLSLLGLSEGDAAAGGIGGAAADVSLAFAVAGLALGVVGWFTFITFDLH